MRYTLLVVLLGLGACSKRAPAPVVVDAAPVVKTRLDAGPIARSSLPDDACEGCHPEEVDAFRETGMGRSLAPIAAADRIEDYADVEIRHEATGLVYRTWRDEAGRVWQEERFPETGFVRRVEATHVIGSGNHTRSYLGEIDGGVVQLPLTWYGQRKVWDLSPGYDAVDQPRMSRAVEPPCLFCHNDLTPARDDRINAYARPLAHGISCVRCHGDARAHVEAEEAGREGGAIYNPARDTSERQLQLCQGCHLQGDIAILHAGRRWDRHDIGTPLNEYVSVFVAAGADADAFSIASHGQRLARSRCAKESAARMRCTTCHNPHRTATRAGYREACVGCHPGEACGDARGHDPKGDCAGCHMRRGTTSDVPHATFTDHYIRARPRAGQPRPVSTALRDAIAGARTEGPAAQVRLGLAHPEVWAREGRAAHLPLAAETLSAALKRDPRRGDAWSALARVRRALGDVRGAAQAMEEAVRRGDADPRFPEDRAAVLAAARRHGEALAVLEAATPTAARLTAAARAAAAAGDAGRAGALLRRAARLAPSDAGILEEQARLALARRDVSRARDALRGALRLDPLLKTAAMRLASLDLGAGDVVSAEALASRVLRLDPRAGAALLIRGQARVARRAGAEALADLDAALQILPAHPVVTVARAAALGLVGRVEEGRRALARASNGLPAGHPAMTEALRILKSASVTPR